MKRIIVIIIVLSIVGFLGYSYAAYSIPQSRKAKYENIALQLKTALGTYVEMYSYQNAGDYVKINMSYYKKNRSLIDEKVKEIVAGDEGVQIQVSEYMDESK